MRYSELQVDRIYQQLRRIFCASPTAEERRLDRLAVLAAGFAAGYEPVEPHQAVQYAMATERELLAAIEREGKE